MFGNDVCVYALCVLRVRTARVQQQSDSMLVCVDHLYARVDIAYTVCVYMCGVCAMIRKHVACATMKLLTAGRV